MLSTELIPEEYASELETANIEIEQTLAKVNEELPDSSLPYYYLFPLLNLMSQTCLVEISDDDDENEEVGND